MHKISAVEGDDELWSITMTDYEEAKGKPFAFLELEFTKCLQKIPIFHPMMPNELASTDKTMFLKDGSENCK